MHAILKIMTTILYIPGLGGRYDGLRRLLLRVWVVWGVRTVFVPITWYDGGDFESKYKQVAQAIRQVGHARAVIVGESAGASLALHAAADPSLQIRKVVTVCGVTRRNTPINPMLRRRAPALDNATRMLPETYGVPVVSLRAVVDHVVGRRFSTAPGASSHTIWSVGHLSTILLCLTVLAPYLIYHARRP